MDFYCATARLVIEVDGPTHDHTLEPDADRQAFLESLGLRVIRFTNDTILNHTASVVAAIDAILSGADEPVG